MIMQNDSSSSKAKLFLLSLVIFGLSIMLSACGEAQKTENNLVETANVIIGLTDAEGDFQSYIVDVESIRLTHANGAIVETLPVNTRVDFAQYVDVTEFFTVTSVPFGRYTSASMTLNYSNAEIFVSDQNDNAIPATSIKDADGNIINTLELKVSLDGHQVFRVSRGLTHHMTLDFDLNNSNAVTIVDGNNAEIIVDPVLVADLEFKHPRTHRLRGLLSGVDETAEEFQILIRPFYHRLQRDENRFGEMKVQVNEETQYSIDQSDYIGSAGLSQLAIKDSNTAVVVRGQIKANPLRFVATHVIAGNNLMVENKDVAQGSVLSRNGNELILKGVSMHRQDGNISFQRQVKVLLADTTEVKKPLADEVKTIADISVGQRLAVTGETSGNSEDKTIDASNGQVRLLLSEVLAQKADDNQLQVPSDFFVVKANRINKLDIAAYHFSGTGTDETTHANPIEYEIDLGDLSLDPVATNTPLLIKGFVSAFGSAPADFLAQSVAIFNDYHGTLRVSWENPNTAAISDTSETGFNVNLNDLGKFHQVSHGRFRTDLSVYSQVNIQLATEGVYAINTKGHDDDGVYVNASSFLTKLNELIVTGKHARSIIASGDFNEAELRFNAKTLNVRMQ
ncbi:MAG: DUF4382 domain-containing protein [Gammaproteobacteria bacterium]|nr:DUF4382 domain-containing protein [Gammaproteobacteria bacterium]